MSMNKTMIFGAALILSAAFSLPAFAVTGDDTAAGSPCANEDAVRVSANPSDTAGYILTCASGTWVAQISADAPTSNSHVTTKSYVDAAVAGASGSGGGSGATCYYAQNTSSCASGFFQAPGNIKFDTNESAAIICCSSATGTARDSNPNAFDFPHAGPNADGLLPGDTTFPYEWSAVQVSGFDSAAVTISGTNVEYRICGDPACSNIIKGWRTSSEVIYEDEYLQIRITSPAITTATVNVGDVSDTADVGLYGWRVFLTSGSWSGNLGGVSGADAKCMAAASANGLGGTTWRAWVSASSSEEVVDRFENVSTTGPFILLDGTPVADSWAGLASGSIDNPIDIDEHLNEDLTYYVWTNTNADGTINTASGNYGCQGFTSVNSGASYRSPNGLSSATSANWAAGSFLYCSSGYRLYCFQTE